MLSTFWISPFALLDNVSSYTLKSQKVITSLHLVIIILLVFMDLLYITCVMLQLCAVFETLWTIAHQAPMPMKFSDQEYWSGLPESSSRGSFQPRIEPTSLMSSALTGGFFITSTTWEAIYP